jgi:NlpC/P60 family putative phage cell wall peptidase
MTARRFSADGIVEEARSWIGTPYRHQASQRGIGADCLGLVRGVWRGVDGREPGGLPTYSPDWGEVGAREPLLEGLRRHLAEVAAAEMAPGDVAVFRMRARAVAKHVGIVAGAPGALTLVHAYSDRAVCEQGFGPAWRTRLAGVFRFPGGTGCGGN